MITRTPHCLSKRVNLPFCGTPDSNAVNVLDTPGVSMREWLDLAGEYDKADVLKVYEAAARNGYISFKAAFDHELSKRYVRSPDACVFESPSVPTLGSHGHGPLGFRMRFECGDYREVLVDRVGIYSTANQSDAQFRLALALDNGQTVELAAVEMDLSPGYNEIAIDQIVDLHHTVGGWLTLRAISSGGAVLTYGHSCLCSWMPHYRIEPLMPMGFVGISARFTLRCSTTGVICDLARELADPYAKYIVIWALRQMLATATMKNATTLKLEAKANLLIELEKVALRGIQNALISLRLPDGACGCFCLNGITKITWQV